MSGHFDQLAAALADRYTIERELGRGGMATVYLAQDLRHRRRVAVLDPPGELERGWCDHVMNSIPLSSPGHRLLRTPDPMPITMPTRSASALAAVLIASVAACGDTIEPPLQRDAIRIEGSVVDAAGAPLAGAFAVLLVGTSIKELPSPGDAPYAVTASDGGYAVTQSALTGAVGSSVCGVNPSGW